MQQVLVELEEENYQDEQSVDHEKGKDRRIPELDEVPGYSFLKHTRLRSTNARFRMVITPSGQMMHNN